jgi:NADPH:quinone reductase-like Zn-dependent oxidoreductase
VKAFTLPSFDASAEFGNDWPEPQAGEGEVLVRVGASSVNPVDGLIALGALKELFDYDFPVTIGRDYAGVVEDVGTEVRAYKPGDEVYGYLLHAGPKVHAGTWAELIAVPEQASIAAKPAIELEEAGAAPLAGISAILCLEMLDLSDGDVLLIIGASGGVGSFATQLAASTGVTVLAPALPEDDDYLRALGAAELVDRDGDLAAQVPKQHPDGVDAVLDLVSQTNEAFEEHAAFLKPDGRAASPLGAAGEGPGRHNIMAAPSTENLERLSGLLNDGTLRVPIQRRFKLAQAAEALEVHRTSHSQGKLAIAIR